MPETQPVGENVRVPAPSREDLKSLERQETAAPASPAAVREGLPRSYRMRADAHYIEQLDTRSATTPVRNVAVTAIDAEPSVADTLSSAFLDSIKRHGVLQPLLVESRGSRFTIIAGRRRLAAAAAVGLREVPCLVQRIEGDQAAQLALATNVPASRPRLLSAPDGHAESVVMTEVLTDLLANLASCANLLSTPSSLTQGMAADLIQAEASRALNLLILTRVLRDEIPVQRAPVYVRALVGRVAAQSSAALRLRRATLQVDCTMSESVTVHGDERLLAAALAALVHATTDLVDATPELTLQLRAGLEHREHVCFVVAQRRTSLPAAWLAHSLETPVPVRQGRNVFALMQAAQRIARAHGGDVSADSEEGGTALRLRVPVAAL